MASFTASSDPRFRTGTVLNVYPGTGGGRASSSEIVTSATVAADGTVTFTGLPEGHQYVAGVTLAGPFVSFEIPVAAASGGGGGGGGTGGSIQPNVWDDDAGWPPRPDAVIVEWYAPEEGGYSDPTDLMFSNDKLIANSLPTG